VSFSVSLNGLIEKTKGDVDRVVRRATLKVFRSVILKSPVDTGRFKGNWNVSYGVPIYTYDARLNKAPLGTLGGFGEAEASKAEALPVGGITYIANGLPYAGRLEDGYSRTQAPFGMVGLTVIEFDTFVKQAIQSL